MYTSHQRSGDFIAAIERHWRRLNGERPVSVDFVADEALRIPAGRFYVSRNYAYKNLLRRRRGEIPAREKPYRRAMWDEMERALADRLSAAPGESEWEALDWVISNYTAPRASSSPPPTPAISASTGSAARKPRPTAAPAWRACAGAKTSNQL